MATPLTNAPTASGATAAKPAAAFEVVTVVPVPAVTVEVPAVRTVEPPFADATGKAPLVVRVGPEAWAGAELVVSKFDDLFDHSFIIHAFFL